MGGSGSSQHCGLEEFVLSGHKPAPHVPLGCPSQPALHANATACTEQRLLPSTSALHGDLRGATQVWGVLADVVGVSQVSGASGQEHCASSAHPESSHTALCQAWFPEVQTAE